MIEPLRIWLASRAPRERVLLAIVAGAGLLACVLAAALAASFFLFGPRLQVRAASSAPIVGALALVACAATSYAEAPPRYPHSRSAWPAMSTS